MPIYYKGKQISSLMVGLAEGGGGGGGTGDVVLEHLEIAHAPYKTTYAAEQLFNPTGMQVVAVFSNGVNLYVPLSDVEFNPGLDEQLPDGLTAIDVSFTWDGITKSVAQPVLVSFAGVYVVGVEWDYTNPSTKLTRLTPQTDPYGLVTYGVTSEPIPATDNETNGYSPFDILMPWAGMDEFNIIDNEVSYRKDVDDLFSRTQYDTMVYIPEYYYAVREDTVNQKMYFYVGDQAAEGLSKHPGSGRYVGRYTTCVIPNTSVHRSISGYAPLVSITRATMRSNSHTKGAKWWMLDYVTWCAWIPLYLVEFADWNSQSTIGMGIVSETAAHVSGETDNMIYHTGKASGENGHVAVQYRHIENPWGNVWQFIDGIVAQDKVVWAGTDNASFVDTTSGLTNTGLNMSNVSNGSYPTKIGISSTAPWVYVPTAGGGSDNTYIPDVTYNGTGTRIAYVGGAWSNTAASGLVAFNAHNGAAYLDTSIGGRLLYKP